MRRSFLVARFVFVRVIYLFFFGFTAPFPEKSSSPEKGRAGAHKFGSNDGVRVRRIYGRSGFRIRVANAKQRGFIFWRGM